MYTLLRLLIILMSYMTMKQSLYCIVKYDLNVLFAFLHSLHARRTHHPKYIYHYTYVDFLFFAYGYCREPRNTSIGCMHSTYTKSIDNKR